MVLFLVSFFLCLTRCLVYMEKVSEGLGQERVEEWPGF